MLKLRSVLICMVVIAAGLAFAGCSSDEAVAPVGTDINPQF